MNIQSFTKTFLRGLGVVLPVALTLWIIIWIAKSTEQLMKPLFVTILSEDYYLQGLGLVFGVAVIYFTGVLVQVFFIKRVWEIIQGLLERIPLVKTIYTAISDFFEFFSSSPSDDSAAVVSVNVTDDMRLIGFVTDPEPDRRLGLGEGNTHLSVYLPMSYQIGGYTLLVPVEKITPLDIGVEEAMRLVLTAGIQKRGE